MTLDSILLVSYNGSFQAACHGPLSVPVPPAGSRVEQNAPAARLKTRSGKTAGERIDGKEMR